MRWFSFLFFLTLAGCASGGTNVSGAPDRLSGFDQLSTAVGLLDVTPVTQLPDGGQVGYSGAAMLNIPVAGEIIPYVADLSVSIGFGPESAEISGTLGAFQSAGNGDLTGMLTISSGTFNAAADPDHDYQFTAHIGGALTDSAAVYLLDGDLAGDFRGHEGVAMAGVIFGDVTTGGEIDIFDGAFAATAQA